MKYTVKIIAVLAAVIMLVTSVPQLGLTALADGPVTVTDSDGLEAAAAGGQSVILGENIALSADLTFQNGSGITLDLNGKRINCSTRNLTFITDAVITDSSSAADGLIVSAGACAVYIGGAGTPANVVFSGGGISCTGDGVRICSGSSFTVSGGSIDAAEFGVLNDGTFTLKSGSVESTGESAVFANLADSETLISGGTAKGARSAAEIRAGSLSVSGGTLRGCENAYELDASSPAPTAKGCAVSVRQNSSRDAVSVTVSGGALYGYTPFCESNSFGNPKEDTAKITYDIRGGVFHSKGGASVSVEDYSGAFIRGGSYTHNVTEYVKDGCREVAYGNRIYVVQKRNLTVTSGGHGTLTANVYEKPDGTNAVLKEENISGTYNQAGKYQIVKLSVTPDNGWQIDKITYSSVSNGTITTATEEFDFIMPDEDVVVSAEFKKIPAEPETEPAAEPDTVPEPAEETPAADKEAKASTDAKKNTAETYPVIYWDKVKNADRYVVYAAYCGKANKYKKTATLKSGKTSYKIKKIGGKKLNPKKTVKAYVVAYRKKNGKYVKISRGPTLHIAGSKAKCTNASKLTLKKKSITLKKGKKAAVKATVKTEDKSKKLIDHVAKLRYRSSDKKVATVTKSGKIKAKGKGTCRTYVYTHNGLTKTVKVKVK